MTTTRTTFISRRYERNIIDFLSPSPSSTRKWVFRSFRSNQSNGSLLCPPDNKVVISRLHNYYSSQQLDFLGSKKTFMWKTVAFNKQQIFTALQSPQSIEMLRPVFWITTLFCKYLSVFRVSKKSIWTFMLLNRKSSDARPEVENCWLILGSK